MIINETEVTERMNSPLNLLNRLRIATSKTSSHSNILSIPPTASEVIENLEDKLAYGSIKSKAANIMLAAMDELKTKIPEVHKPSELARIAELMSKVVHAEVKDPRDDKEDRPQYVIYAPQVNNENHYETIYARE